MKINHYYQEVAKISLNDSIASLIPSLLIAAGNLAIFNDPDIMKLTIPFLLYSIICFQIYLYRMKQSIRIGKNIKKEAKQENGNSTVFDSSQLLVLYQNSQLPKLQLYFPDGMLAGVIKKYPQKGFMKWRVPKAFALYNQQEELIGLYQHLGKRINVYDQNLRHIGSFEKRKVRKKVKGEILDKERKVIGSVEGSSMFMDEQILNQNHHEVVRLRRGWMPLEWSAIFPDANTPVLSIQKDLPDSEKLLGMAFLIQEYFVER
ncbi:hypothetical protein [Neobacillus dielmonensis]|uniref:hypothetical protein n=1 Tax=Neobacillus dielmonensis TaxID=1347369 RepID=UPI0005A65228|nr:hypothetical protein [Neobacillus dielmonensis]